MMTMAIPDDLYIRENAEKIKKDEKIYCQDLELLVPKQVKDMINNYKEKMNQFISQNLDNYENEQTISKFVQNLFLPKKLTKKPGEEDFSSPPSEFPPQLWQKIEQVQQMEGTECLSRIMNGIMRKSSYLINELENLLKSLEAEDKDDQMCRQRFRDKWIRKTSQELNFKLVQGAKNYLQSLNNTKKYDIQENNNIMNEARFYEQLLLPREQLLNKIPRREELQEKEIPEETEIHEAILKLYELGDKCMQIINPIFAELNAYHTELLDYAFKKRVWITSPTTLISTLTVIQMIIKNMERDKYTSIIHEELNKLGVEFNRYKDRWDKLSRSIETVSKDVNDIHTTTEKITKRFDSISRVDIDKKEIK